MTNSRLWRARDIQDLQFFEALMRLYSLLIPIGPDHRPEWLLNSFIWIDAPEPDLCST